uniref:Uncharacterized protein n=1 Tax=Zea mays TaxID=4577 RepID=C4J7U5_MAIZE|nr:unknown [Zea mays]
MSATERFWICCIILM